MGSWPITTSDGPLAHDQRLQNRTKSFPGKSNESPSDDGVDIGNIKLLPTFYPLANLRRMKPVAHNNRLKKPVIISSSLFDMNTGNYSIYLDNK